MKKVLSIIGCCVLLSVMVGCADAKIYNEAKDALESGNYSQAILLLDSIPEYADKESIRVQAEEMIAYENAVSQYQQAVSLANNENNDIDSICNAAQELLSSGRTPYEDSKITDLQVAISTLREMKKTITSMPLVTDEILTVVEELGNPLDYSDEKNNILTAQKALEDSYKQFEQVSNPTGDFIVLKLKQIEDIGEIQGVTEDQDPNGMLNKQGGYTSATFFSSPLLGTSKPLKDGTDGGGCIEVFSTAAEADVRNSYLAAFDGTGFASGSHVVIGSIIIRTSNNFTATQQKELTAAIIAKLLELQ